MKKFARRINHIIEIRPILSRKSSKKMNVSFGQLLVVEKIT